MEENLELLALAETLDNGKPIRETKGADVPLVIDHFRYFAGCIRVEKGAISTIDNDTIAYHFKEPLGVFGQIIPWNLPLLIAAWKIAPAPATGDCTVVQPASNTPLVFVILAGLTADILPPGALNVVTGPSGSVGQAIAANSRISKVSFAGETTTGKQIMRYAAEHLISRPWSSSESRRIGVGEPVMIRFGFRSCWPARAPFGFFFSQRPLDRLLLDRIRFGLQHRLEMLDVLFRNRLVLGSVPAGATTCPFWHSPYIEERARSR